MRQNRIESYRLNHPYGADNKDIAVASRAPTAAHGSHPTTTHEYPVLSIPISVPQRLFNKLLQSNFQIHTITIFTTQYSPSLTNYVSTIEYTHTTIYDCNDCNDYNI